MVRVNIFEPNAQCDETQKKKFSLFQKVTPQKNQIKNSRRRHSPEKPMEECKQIGQTKNHDQKRRECRTLAPLKQKPMGIGERKNLKNPFQKHKKIANHHYNKMFKKRQK